ncbi:MAG: hypothetical protein OSB18_00510 [SAR324 cluster bacterium]|nr:hypothetical protein [SAR324 cluster bacterium]
MSVNTDNPQAPASSEGLDSLADRTSFLDIPPEAERRYLEAVQLGDAPPAGVNKPLEQNKRYNLFVKPGMLRNRKSPRVVEIAPDMPTEKAENAASSVLRELGAENNDAPPESPPTPEPDLQAESSSPPQTLEKPDNLALEETPTTPKVKTLEPLPVDSVLEAGLGGRETPVTPIPILSELETSGADKPPDSPPPDLAPAENNLSWGLGVMEKLALVVMAGVIGFAGLLVVGGYLELFDASVFQQFTRGYVHQFEFEKPLRSRRARNAFNRNTLLVVEGRVRNQFLTSSHVGRVRLKALALGPQGQVLDESVFFAGVVLSDEELENMGLSEIRELQQMAVGRDAPNLNLRNEQEIPFQAVFFRTSDEVGDVQVKLVSYERSGKSVFVRFPDSQ